MVKERYLTKSRFKLATKCPTKLIYTGKECYANQNLDDSFRIGEVFVHESKGDGK